MIFQLLISKASQNDLIEATEWYESKRIGLSLDFELCIEVGLNQIVSNPYYFQIRYNEIRINFINRFPYGIHYRIKENRIEVIGVFHTSRNPTNWEKRQ
jgi:toxin ParE1/3/4